MKHIFPGYYTPSNDEFNKLWKQCVFIFDTNVLLNLYRYPQQAREDILRVLKKITARLWIPHHVALEFERSRLLVIAEQNRKYIKVREIVDKAHSDLVNGFNSLQLKKRHALINPDKFVRDHKDLIEDFKKELSALESNTLQVNEKDSLRDTITELFKDKVGQPPGNQDELNTIYKDCGERYNKKIPPGYMDIGKDSAETRAEYAYGGLTYQRQYGDCLLWHQMIDWVKNAKHKHVIFVTDDDKEDWWWTIDSSGEKVIGPRPELIDEMVRRADVELFHMYNSQHFMELAERYLSVPVKKESIQQVKDIAEVAGKRTRLPNWPITAWIFENFPGVSSVTEEGDYV